MGLLTGSFLKKTALDVLDGNPDINYGSIYENAVAQELRAHGFDLYYYNSKKLGELDFLIQDRNDHVLPIEVKSGKSTNAIAQWTTCSPTLNTISIQAMCLARATSQSKGM